MPLTDGPTACLSPSIYIYYVHGNAAHEPRAKSLSCACTRPRTHAPTHIRAPCIMCMTCQTLYKVSRSRALQSDSTVYRHGTLLNTGKEGPPNAARAGSIVVAAWICAHDDIRAELHQYFLPASRPILFNSLPPTRLSVLLHPPSQWLLLYD